MKIKLFLLSLIFVVSCAKDDTVGRGDMQEQTYDYSFEALALNEESSNVNSRVEFDPMSKVFTWSNTDQVLVSTKESGSNAAYQIFYNKPWLGSKTYLPFTTTQSGARVHFTVSGSSLKFDQNKTYNYKGVFPYPKGEITDESSIAYTIPAVQKGVIDASNCLLVSYEENAPAFVEKQQESASEWTPSFGFKHLLTYLAFSVKDVDKAFDSSFEVLGFDIVFPQSKAIVGDVTLNPADATATDLQMKVGVSSNVVKIRLEKPIKPSATFSKEHSAVVACLPFEIAEGEQFDVTILGRSVAYRDMHQTVACVQKKGSLVCDAGHFRKISLRLKMNEMTKTNDVTPVGGNSIQEMLGDPSFAPLADESNYEQIYGSNGNNNFKQAGQVLTAGSRIWQVGNEVTGQNENVIVLDNTVSRSGVGWGINHQSAFYMPVDTVLPNFYEEKVQKDLEVTFKVFALMSGLNSDVSLKAAAPLILALNHCDESTWKTGDGGFVKLTETLIPKDKVMYSPQEADGKGYPAVPANPGWVEQKITLSGMGLTMSQFLPNSNGTPAYIGFKIDSYSDNNTRMLLYIKDVQYREVNRRPKLSYNWMSAVKGETLLSDLSIPGTHDAATGYMASGAWKCQTLSITEQLGIGVRALDLRPSAAADLMMTHGSTSTGVTFGYAIDEIETFLKQYPSETVIVTMKNENGNDKDWAVNMGNYIEQNRNREVSASKKLFAAYHKGMTLEEARGQIVLLARNDYEGALLGGKITPWSDSSADDLTTIADASGATDNLFVQDNYSFFSSTQSKKTAIQDYLDKARTKSAEDWMFNYLSMAGDPQDNAVTFNYFALDYLRKNPGKTGVVFMDFAGQTLSMGNEMVWEVTYQNPGVESLVNQE